MEIWTTKPKILAFLGKLPVRAKIVLNNKPIKQFSSLKYLGYNIDLDDFKNFIVKLSNFQYMFSTSKRVLYEKKSREF